MLRRGPKGKYVKKTSVVPDATGTSKQKNNESRKHPKGKHGTAEFYHENENKNDVNCESLLS